MTRGWNLWLELKGVNIGLYLLQTKHFLLRQVTFKRQHHMYISSYHQNIFFAFRSHPNLPPLGRELGGVLMTIHQSVQLKPHFRKVLPPGGVAEILCHITPMTHFIRWENSEDEWTKNTSELEARRTRQEGLSGIGFRSWFFFFLAVLWHHVRDSKDFVEATWEGDWNVWFIYTLKTFYVLQDKIGEFQSLEHSALSNCVCNYRRKKKVLC